MNEKQLKTIKGAKYRVITDDDGVFDVGAIVTLVVGGSVDSEGAQYIQEGNSYGSRYMYFTEIELVELPENALGGEVAATAETPEPLYTVGQKLRVKGSGNTVHHHFKIGTDVEVERVNISESGNRSYVTVSAEHRWSQIISEADLEPAPQPHISEEEFAAIKVGDKIVLRSDLEIGSGYGDYIVRTEMADLGKRGVEITVERVNWDDLKGSAEGDFWFYTFEMIAKVIHAIKPKFQVGDVLNRSGAATDMGCARLVIEVDEENSEYCMQWADGTAPKYRMEYSFENVEENLIKVEGLPPRLINPKGAVITAGNYYAVEGHIYDTLIKVTDIDAVNQCYVYTEAVDRITGLKEGNAPATKGSPYFRTAVPATPEQIEQFKKLENPAEPAEENTPEFDNPEVEVGKVYMDDDGWMFYCDDVSKIRKVNGVRKIYVQDVTAFNAYGELRLEADYGCNKYREATPEEAIKLLSAAFQDKAA